MNMESKRHYKSDKERRTRNLTLRLTEYEQERLRRLALAGNITMAEYMRRHIQLSIKQAS